MRQITYPPRGPLLLTSDDPTDQPTTATDESTDRFTSADLSPPDDRPPARQQTSDLEAERPSEHEDDEPIVSRPVTMAILSHTSVLFGVPVFLVPLLRRRHALSLHHAKAAALVWLAFYATLALSFFVSGLFTPVMLLLYLPALIGIHRAVQGREAGRWGAGDLAEWLFRYPRVES